MKGSGGWGHAGLVVAALLLAAQPFRAADGADAAVRQQLAGEWTLVKYEVFGESGQTRPGNYDIGRINYGEREMSAHLMRSERPAEPQNYRRSAPGLAPSRCATTDSRATARSSPCR
jgi:hypothetical protein